MAVVTISANYGAHCENTTKTTTGNIQYGSVAPTYRAAIRFSLSSAPSGTPTKAELIIKTVSSGGTTSVRAYNSNGQADPNADSAATFYTRANGTAYVTGSTGFNGAGVHTVDVTAGTILADIAAAKIAVDRFSFGFTQDDGFSTVAFTPDEDATDPPKLRLTYADANSAGLFWGWV